MHRKTVGMLSLAIAFAGLCSQSDCIAEETRAAKTASPFAQYRPVDVSSVQFTDGFWAGRFETARSVTLPRLWELAEPWAWHNMLVAAGRKEGQAKGCRWEDAWIYKRIESACHFQAQHPDPQLLQQIDDIIDVIAAAQQPDGYLATQITLRGLKRLSFNGNHELYTMGHLLTAACVHHRITGKTNLLDVARRTADWCYNTYQQDDPMLANCPINPSIIMGAVELYRETGEKRYLDLANIIINNRGRKRGPVPRTNWGQAGNTDVNQDRVPLRQAQEVVGHAVFWSYLYAGAADAYMETGDNSLLTALDQLWYDLTYRKLYITGGVSPLHKGLSSRSPEPGKRIITNDMVHESSGLPYELPSASAYNETCGQIGNVMWNSRMLAITGEPRFAEVAERTLYNAILSGVNLSGQGWSYTNPLRWYGRGHELLLNDDHSRFDPGEKHICCPTNLLRTEASWNGCLYATQPDGVTIHHYAASRAQIPLTNGGQITLSQQTRFPWDGDVRITLEQLQSSQPWELRMRIPDWTANPSITVNGEPIKQQIEPSSYVTLQRAWKAGDVIELRLPMPVRLMTGHPKLEHARGQAAVTRGPIVYCLESTDLPEGVAVADVHLRRDCDWKALAEPELLSGVTVLETDAVILPSAAGDALYRPLSNSKPRAVKIRMIPYYAWNNRGEPEMTVWLPID